MNKARSNRAFTLIEVIFAVAILAVVSAFGINALKEFGRSHALTAATEAVAAGLTEARAKTLASEGGQRFGLHFEESEVVLFTEDYVAGAATNKNILSSDSRVRVVDINVSGGNDVIFEKISGETLNYGTVTLIYGTTSASSTIEIEQTGTVSILND
jgi:prepilin-type N-terminal cleavage/methylation domain-containing protein